MNHHKWQQMISNVILAIPFLVGCVAKTPMPPTSTPMPTPTSTPIPTPTPPPVMGWKGATVNTICLEVKQTYPEIEHKSPEPIDIPVTELLKLMGFRVLGWQEQDKESCDARLSIDLTGKALKANYLGAGYAGYCFTGAEYKGQIILASAGQTSLVVPIYAVKEPPKTIYGCDKGKDPQNAPFKDVWTGPVFDSLISIWGPQVLINGLGVIGDLECLFKYLDHQLREMDKDAIPLLVEGLGHSNSSIRITAARRLAQNSGPDGRKALASVEPKVLEAVVPQLIKILERWEDKTVSETLKVITGEDFGQDASLWRDWWEKRQ